MIEKTFALIDSKIIPVIGRYHTIHEEVEIVFLNKKYEWPNRAKEEVLKCDRCKSFILPKNLKMHKQLCKSKKEIPNDITARVDAIPIME